MLVSQAYGLMAAALAGDPNGALIIVTLVFIILLSFTGFLTTSVPVYFLWVKHVSFINYATSAIWVNEMSGATFETADGQQVCVSPDCPIALLSVRCLLTSRLYLQVSGNEILSSPEHSRISNGSSVAENIGYLVANLAVLHFIALISVMLCKRFNRL